MLKIRDLNQGQIENLVTDYKDLNFFDLIVKEQISLVDGWEKGWIASKHNTTYKDRIIDPSPHLAVLKCLLISRYGETINKEV